MDYSLEEVHQKIKTFSDKMGSDYFPLPIILKFFQTAAYDFIGERLRAVEKTQEITDDIRNLVKPRNLPIVFINEDSPIPEPIYAAAVPEDYLRLLAYTIYYKDGTQCRRVNLSTQAEYEMRKLNPNRKPSRYYPVLLQEENIFKTDCGEAIGDILKITYGKKPTIATTGDKEQRIINLPDDAIEKILLMTVTRLFSKTADERGQTSYQLQEAYRKMFR